MTDAGSRLQGADLTDTANLGAALQLGWRIAELYAQVNDTGAPAHDTLLPSHGNLEPADQLELQLRAAAGDARRAGIGSTADSLERLTPLARKAPRSDPAAEEFRAGVRDCHVEIAKELWASDEAIGKAYELGNGMSDTYGRICRSYRESCHRPVSDTWLDVFGQDRIMRLKKLLDDLQSRLNPDGVAVVRRHLDSWRDAVPDRLRAAGGPPDLKQAREGLRRQTVTWRQLLAGDKEPEAYLDSHARGAVRGELRELVWKRYSRWVVPAALILFAVVYFLPQIVSLYEAGMLRTGLASATVAILGALGITKASVGLTVRTRAHQWSQLLWENAVVIKVSEATLLLDEVLPPPPPASPHSLSDVAAGVKDRITPRTHPVRRARASF
jgi:hypothetical protein